jgi:hypothetical protein
MLAPFLTTSLRTSRPASEATDDASSCHPASWGARIIQVVLAVYLLPVLVLVLLIGGVGMAIVGLVGLVAKVSCWNASGGSSDPEIE